MLILPTLALTLNLILTLTLIFLYILTETSIMNMRNLLKIIMKPRKFQRMVQEHGIIAIFIFFEKNL